MERETSFLRLTNRSFFASPISNIYKIGSFLLPGSAGLIYKLNSRLFRNYFRYILVFLFYLSGNSLSSAQNSDCSINLEIFSYQTGVCHVQDVTFWTRANDLFTFIRWEKKELNEEGTDITDWITIDSQFYKGDSLTLRIDKTILLRKIYVSNNRDCPFLSTAPLKVWFVNTISPGKLISPSTACVGDNQAVLKLIDAQNRVIAWEKTVFDPEKTTYLSHSQTSLAYYNLTETTVFRALVRGCNPFDTLFSTSVEITVVKCSLCLKPSNFEIKKVTTHSAELTWVSPFKGSIFEIFVRPEGGSWQSIARTKDVKMTITNLIPCKNYEAKVVCVCGTTVSDFQIIRFSTIPTVTNIRISEISRNSALINWDPMGEEISTKIRYRIINNINSPWITTSYLNTSSRRLISLYANVVYEVQVKTKCGNATESEWIKLTTFRTSGSTSSCDANVRYPDKISSSIFLNRFAIVRWRLPQNAKGIWLNYGLAKLNPNMWVSIFVCAPADSTFLMNLIQGEQYRYRIRSLCESCAGNTFNQVNKSNWSPIMDLSMPSKEESEISNYISNNFEIYPNPASDQIKLKGFYSISNENGNQDQVSSVKLVDLTGKVITALQIDQNQNQEFGIWHASMDVSIFPSGIYFLRIEYLNGTSGRYQKLIISK